MCFICALDETDWNDYQLKTVSVRAVYWQSCHGSTFPLFFFNNFCPASSEEQQYSPIRLLIFFYTVFPIEGNARCLQQQMHFVWWSDSLKPSLTFISSVVFRARRWFPFSPCSLNMPWPGFPHVMRMIHHYGLHWSFIYYLLLYFLALCLPISLSPSQQSPISTAWPHCMVFLWALFLISIIITFGSESCMLHLAMSRMLNSMYSLFISFFFKFFLEETHHGDLINLL